MGTHPIFESDFDCLTVSKAQRTELKWVAVTKSASRLTAKPLVPSKWLSRVAHVPKKHESKYPIVRTIFWAAACRVDRKRRRALPDDSLALTNEPSPLVSPARIWSRWQTRSDPTLSRSEPMRRRS